MPPYLMLFIGVATIILAAAIIGSYKVIQNKANKADLLDPTTIATKTDLSSIDNKFEKKLESIETEGTRQYRELKVSIEVLQKEITLLDKHSLTQADLGEMKLDIKELIKGQAETLKLIDGLPGKVDSLEATRNKQSEK